MINLTVNNISMYPASFFDTLQSTIISYLHEAGYYTKLALKEISTETYEYILQDMYESALGELLSIGEYSILDKIFKIEEVEDE